MDQKYYKFKPTDLLSLELDKIQNYNFDSAEKFFNEELPNKDEFISSFKRFSKEYSLPIKVDSKFESTILNSIKSYSPATFQ